MKDLDQLARETAADIYSQFKEYGHGRNVVEHWQEIILSALEQAVRMAEMSGSLMCDNCGNYLKATPATGSEPYIGLGPDGTDLRKPSASVHEWPDVIGSGGNAPSEKGKPDSASVGKDEPWMQNSNELYKGSGLENFIGLALNSHEAWKIKDAHNATLAAPTDDTKRLDWLCQYHKEFLGETMTRESIDAAMRSQARRGEKEQG